MSVTASGNDELHVDVIHRGSDCTVNNTEAGVIGTLRASEDRYIRKLRWKFDAFAGDVGIDHQIGFRSEIVDGWGTDMDFAGGDTITSQNTGVLQFVHHELHYISDTASGTGGYDGTNRTITWEYEPGEVEWLDGEELEVVEYISTDDGSFRASITVYWEEM